MGLLRTTICCSLALLATLAIVVFGAGAPGRVLAFTTAAQPQFGQFPSEREDEEDDEEDGEDEEDEDEFDEEGDDEEEAPRPPPPPFLRSVWSTSLPAPPVAGPGFDDAHAYIPLREGGLVAATLTDGAVRWSSPITTQSAPVPGGGLIYVASDEQVIAISPADGTRVWAVRLGGLPSAPLSFDNGWLFAGTSNAELFAIRANDGHLLWRRGLGSPLRARAAAAAERVFVSLDDGRVAALDLHTGDTVWERRLGGTPASILPLQDRLFVGSKDNYLYCLNVANGNVRWRWRTGADVIGTPIVDGSRVYFLSLDNVLRAHDRGGGGMKWQRGLPFRASAGPLRLEDLLIVPGVAAEFTAFAAEDGEPAGNYRASADLAAPPHLHQPAPETRAQVIIVTRDGRLEALERAAVPDPAAPPVEGEVAGPADAAAPEAASEPSTPTSEPGRPAPGVETPDAGGVPSEPDPDPEPDPPPSTPQAR